MFLADLAPVDQGVPEVVDEVLKQRDLPLVELGLDDVVEVFVLLGVVVDRHEGEGHVDPVAIDLLVARDARKGDQ